MLRSIFRNFSFLHLLWGRYQQLHSLLRLISTPENKQRIGPDKNKTKSAHAPSVEIFGSD
jgi:hypothetical protein